MGKNSGIEWTTHTFNPWWGCVKVSPGCEHCYAETLANRYQPGIWGPAKTTDRRLFGDKHWRDPLKWHDAAVKAGERHRVFVASMADVFEDHPQVEEARYKLFEVIDQTPMLDWLLLTKRPENIQRLWPWGFYDDQYRWLNVWLGTSAEDQKRADERIAELLEIPAAVHFLSAEPLLGPINLGNVYWSDHVRLNALTGQALLQTSDNLPRYIKGLDWVIVGGESGPGARPMHPDWALSLRDQCVMANVAFFFKQWGEWTPYMTQAFDRKRVSIDGGILMHKVGKKEAGKILDGREWSQFPEAKYTVPTK